MRSSLCRRGIRGIRPGTNWSQCCTYAAAASGTNALILIPDSFVRDDGTVVDPMPQVELLAASVENWPGVLFWSRSGAAAFAGVDHAIDLYQRLDAGFKLGPRAIDAILEGYRPPRQSRTLLHLSDLHFGTDHAARNLAILQDRLLADLSIPWRCEIGNIYNSTPISRG